MNTGSEHRLDAVKGILRRATGDVMAGDALHWAAVDVIEAANPSAFDRPGGVQRLDALLKHLSEWQHQLAEFSDVRASLDEICVSTGLWLETEANLARLAVEVSEARERIAAAQRQEYGPGAPALWRERRVALSLGLSIAAESGPPGLWNGDGDDPRGPFARALKEAFEVLGLKEKAWRSAGQWALHRLKDV